jgi:hypothetical protein
VSLSLSVALDIYKIGFRKSYITGLIEYYIIIILNRTTIDRGDRNEDN